jgi:general secretion pathway protein L
VLSFEMDRLTPFRADEIYFDYRVVSRDVAAAQIAVQLAVARRELVDARVEKVRSAGINVQGVSVRDDAGQGAAPLDLLPNEQRGERESSRERLVQRVLIGAVVILMMVALLYPVWRKRDAILSLQPVMAQAAQDAQATDGIARELEKQVADHNYLLARKHGNYPALAFVEEVSRLLPDNTWLQQMDVKNAGKSREVLISGETASSSRLIEILEQSRLLQNATPRGTETRGSQANTVRFLIAAEARPRPMPDAVPVLEMAATPAPVAALPVPVIPAAPANPAGAAQNPAGSSQSPAAQPAPPASTKPGAPAVSTVIPIPGLPFRRTEAPSQPRPPASGQGK